LICLRGLHGEEVGKKTEKAWKQLEDASCPVSVLQVFEASAAGPKAGPVVLRTLEPALEVRVSPTGRNVLYVTGTLRGGNPYEDPFSLWVAPVVRNASARLVAKDVSLWPDWSPDGNSVTYAVAAHPGASMGAKGDEPVDVGSISRRMVCDANGALLAELPPPNDLAGIAFGRLLVRVRCLRDGRIVFSTVELHIPTTSRDMPRIASLFSIDPSRQATVTKVFTQEALERLSKPMMQFFEVNPDATKISIMGDKGNVYVYTMASGEVSVVQGEGPKSAAAVPTWRSAKELCYPAARGSQAGSPNRAEVVLWSDGTSRCISKDWPNSATERLFLEN
jgi:hypothetical protein